MRYRIIRTATIYTNVDFIGACFDFVPFRLSWTSWYTFHLYFLFFFCLISVAVIVLGRLHCELRRETTCSRQTLDPHCNSRKQKRRNNMCKLFLCFRYVANFPFCSILVSHRLAETKGSIENVDLEMEIRSTVCLCCPNRGNEMAAFCRWHLFCFRAMDVCFIGNPWHISFSVCSSQMWGVTGWRVNIYSDYEIRNRCEWTNQRYPSENYLCPWMVAVPSEYKYDSRRQNIARNLVGQRATARKGQSVIE